MDERSNKRRREEEVFSEKRENEKEMKDSNGRKVREGEEKGKGEEENWSGEDKKLEEMYFEGYSHLSIHEEMLNDKERTLTYKRAIEANKHLFQGKVLFSGISPPLFSFQKETSIPYLLSFLFLNQKRWFWIWVVELRFCLVFVQ